MIRRGSGGFGLGHSPSGEAKSDSEALGIFPGAEDCPMGLAGTTAV